jgi:hypothetical protein
MPTRRSLLLAALALAAAGASSYALHTGQAASKPQIYAGIIQGVAVGGYDPVAYFTEAMARKGREDVTLEHGGAVWRFASEANREAFKADPERYAPRYGGYCAYAVAHGGTSGGDPRYWNVVGGRLYLNATASVKTKWEKDIPGYIDKADANWPRVLER